MHLPDGFLSVPVSGAMILASAGGVAAALARAEVSRGVSDAVEPVGPTEAEASVGAGGEAGRGLVMMGVLAAFVFVAQMLNIPISGGTSGHLLGAALVTALVGPWRGILVMCVVVLLQALIFADGGLLVLGANVFNMGIVGCLLSGLILDLAGAEPRRRRWALALAAWLSVEAGAGLAAMQLGFSGLLPTRVAVPAMLGVHAVIGLLEAAITVAAYSLLVEARPDLAAAGVRTPATALGREPWRLALVLALGLAFLPLASGLPDGLESVAAAQGFEHAAAEAQTAPLPDYELAGAGATVGTYVSAAVGGLACAAAMWLIGAGLGRRRRWGGARG